MTLELPHEFSVLSLIRQLLVMTYACTGLVWSAAFGELVLFGRPTYLGGVAHFGRVAMELVKIFIITFHFTWGP